MAAIIRVIGLPACIVIGLLIYYEGLPGASRIPFLSLVPVIGDLATGRVHSYAADQVKLATSSLVAKSELAAVAAQLEQERALRRAADDAAAQARIRASASERAKADALIKLNARIAADTDREGAEWTEGDIKWLGR